MVSTPFRNDQRGSIHIALFLAFSLVGSLGIGLWMLLNQYHRSVDLQLKLDRCVGTRALDFRNTLNRLESSNQDLQAIRVSLLASSPLPEIRAPLQAALHAVVLYQEGLRTSWQFKSASWLVSPCVGRGDFPVPLPRLPFERPPPDLIGESPLREIVQETSEFHFQIEHRPRRAAALVSKKPEERNSHGNWKAEWDRWQMRRPSHD